MKLIAVGLLAASIALPAAATPEEMMAAQILGQVMDSARARQMPATPATAAVAYPVPVSGPVVIQAPRCSPNIPCPEVVPIVCEMLPVFDSYGRIISYHRICRN